MTPRNNLAANTTQEPEETRRQSGLRRAVNPAGDERDSQADVETMRPPPPPAAIPGLPTPAELQIAAAQRLTPLTPHVIIRAQQTHLNPRPFLPPQSVRRAFISQMQEEAPKKPRLWPWLTAAIVMAIAGVLLGLMGLYPHLFR